MTDIEPFLQTAAEEGLSVIARPGPYSYSELINNGLPEWLLRNYPEILAQGRNGQAMGYSSVSYLHPVFIGKVKQWYAAVCPIIRTYSAEQGGPIVMVQPDNEAAGIHGWGNTLDCSPEGMDIGKAGGRYSTFLHNRHGSVAGLNRRYGTDFDSFESVSPGRFPAAGLCRMMAEKDYLDFYCRSLADYLGLLRNVLREHGVGLPLCHNPANEKMSPLFLETAQTLGSELLVGVDNYYCLGPHQGQNNPTPQYAVRTFLSMEMLRVMGFPPVVLEIPAGSYSDWPPITPEDLRACYYLHVALGAKGHNYYVFTGGLNPAGVGLTGDIYDYHAPVSASGEVRPAYAVLQEVGEFVAGNAWLCHAELEADFLIALDWDQARARFCPPVELGETLHSGADVWEFVREGLVTSAFCAGLTPRLISLSDVGALRPDKPLVVPSSGLMCAADQKALLAYIERGGQVLIMPVLPHLDELGEPCTVLLDALGATAGSRRAHWGTERMHLDVAGVANVFFNGTLHCPDTVPADAEALGLDSLSGRTFCWRKAHGQGAVLFSGFRWTHCKQEHAAMLAALLGSMGGTRRMELSNPNVWGFVREDEAHTLLFLVNLSTATFVTGVRLRRRDGAEWLELGQHTLAPMTVRCLSVSGQGRT